MLQAIISRAQKSVDSLVSKYVARFVVAVPFLVAAGFGTAAASIKLTELYGSLHAYTMLAFAFAALGTFAAGFIALASPSPQPDAAEEAKAEPAAAMDAPSNGLPNAEIMLTALGALGPSAFATLLRMLARNLPLVAGILVLGYLLLSEAAERDRGQPAPTPTPAE